MASTADTMLATALAAKALAAVRERAMTPGPQGLRGDTGPQGKKGLDGANGAHGLPGAPGAAGQQGPAGAQGPQGQKGEDGAQGPQGRTGNTGPQGQAGEDGHHGAQGPSGKDGAQGPAGPQGPRGKTPDHEWSGSRLRFEKPSGAWGEFVELRGPKGGRGDAGRGGGSGFGASTSTPTAFNPSSLPAAADEPNPSEVLVMQDGQWVRATWAQFAGWLGTVTPPAAIGAILTEAGDRITTEDNSNLIQE